MCEEASVRKESLEKGFDHVGKWKHWDFFVKKDPVNPNIITNFQLHNVDGIGIRLFYAIEPGEYGPIIHQEPDLGITPHSAVYVDHSGKIIQPRENITGIISYDQEGVQERRFSLSQAHSGAVCYSFDKNGIVIINGTTYWIWFLIEKDRNRIRGYDALVYPFTPPGGKIRVIGMTDIGEMLFHFHD